MGPGIPISRFRWVRNIEYIFWMSAIICFSIWSKFVALAFMPVGDPTRWKWEQINFDQFCSHHSRAGWGEGWTTGSTKAPLTLYAKQIISIPDYSMYQELVLSPISVAGQLLIFTSYWHRFSGVDAFAERTLFTNWFTCFRLFVKLVHEEELPAETSN